MERVLIINMQSNFGAFIKPQSNNNPETYAIIPKSALVGMMCANVGHDRDLMKSEHMYSVMTNELEYSLILNTPFKKASWSEYSYNHLNVDNARPNYTPGRSERLYDVNYTVYIKYNTNSSEVVTSTITNFIDNVKSGVSMYPMCMGMSNMPCDVAFVDDFALDEIKIGEFITCGVCTNIISSNDQEYDVIGTDMLPTKSLDFLTMDKSSVKRIYFHENCGKLISSGEHYVIGSKCIEFI